MVWYFQIQLLNIFFVTIQVSFRCQWKTHTFILHSSLMPIIKYIVVFKDLGFFQDQFGIIEG